jgi:alpha-tubulin suppressor-like RCC1 family protein
LDGGSGLDGGRDASSSCDEDGDGQDSIACGGADCDDDDREVFSGAVEVCSASDLSSVTRDENCDPSDRGVQRVGSLVSIDADGDGYASSVCCNADGDTMLCGDDCDDGDPAVHPDQGDECGDGIDQDCDGRFDEGGLLFFDSDNDRRGDPNVSMVGPCTAAWVANADDCDDNSQTTYRGARERCDGRDNDCSLPGAAAGGPDPVEDADGDRHSPVSASCLSRSELGTDALGSEYEKNDCDDSDAMIYAGAPEICFNGIDENCNGIPDDPSGTVYRDADGDGHGTLAESMPIMSCVVPTGWSRSSSDCDDGRANRYSGALEVCDRIDNDCSTPATLVAVDEDVDGDGFAPIGAACIGAGDAMAPAGALPRTDCSDDDATTRPGVVDYCDGQDRDCSSGGGVALDEDADGDGHSPTGGMCIGRGAPGAPGSAYPRDDCDDAHATVHAGLPATADTNACDGLDNDCNPLTNEVGFVCSSGGYCNLGATCGRPPQVVELSAGGRHACARIGDGSVRCWGDNNYGQLGDGTTTNRSTPTTVPGLGRVAGLSAGSEHTCARLGDGTVRCWGRNSGRLGDGTGMSRTSPTEVPDLGGVVELSAGEAHTCARLADGTVRCWGINASGQLGDGTSVGFRLSPILVPGMSGVVELSMGAYHSCARLGDGTVRCWGDNSSGQLGDGTTTNRNSPAAVSGLSGVVEISAGAYHTCARLTSGTVRCWGSNSNAQLGDGTTAARLSPTLVAGLSGAVELTLGSYHSCARLVDESARCWGYNLSGQIGDGTTMFRAMQVAVLGLGTAAELSAGDEYTCARLGDGRVQCWGDNSFGQLGDETTTNRASPTAVATLGVVALELSLGGSHTCARMANGTVQCWGNNASGQLGDGTTNSRANPSAVSSLSDVVAVSAGASHTCARVRDGTVRCWGANGYGQLGDGTTASRTAPVVVPGLSGVVGLTAGFSNTCARLTDGTARCWGYNANGQLGDGTTTDRASPTPVSGLSGVVEISMGAYHSCARLVGGTVRCWGSNFYGELGDGTMIDRATPTLISGLSGVVELSGGTRHTCARLADGTVRCWGDNPAGQVGDGTTMFRTSPVGVGLSGVVELRAGGGHTCVRLSDGTSRCWGVNSYGELGDGTTTDRLSPTGVPTPSGLVELRAGGSHTCGRHRDGAVRCWGSNAFGQLGDWTTASRLTPTLVWDL